MSGPGVDMELDSNYTALDFSGPPILEEMVHLQNLYYALEREELAVDTEINKKADAYATI